MKKHTQAIITFVSFILLAFFQYKFLGNFLLKSAIVTDMITFLSIIFGFYITSLAIFVTSRYVSDLYKITDKDNPNKTLLNTLVSKYEFGLSLILIFIIYLVGIQLYLGQLIEGQFLLLSNFLALPFVPFSLINFIYSYLMLKTLIKIIVQEAKKTHN